MRNENNDTQTNKIKHMVMQLITNLYPEWVNSDGSCPKCENFYNYELSHLVKVQNNTKAYQVATEGKNKLLIKSD